MLRRALLANAVLALVSPAAAQQAPGPLFLVDHYDPKGDPFADIAGALQRAQAERKNILLVVGGDWCVWCTILDRFLASSPRVREELAQSFVLMKVNMSAENPNQDFLSHYPRPRGYPSFVIVDPWGAYLASVDTGELEEGETYNARRFIAFARIWRR